MKRSNGGAFHYIQTRLVYVLISGGVFSLAGVSFFLLRLWWISRRSLSASSLRSFETQPGTFRFILSESSKVNSPSMLLPETPPSFPPSPMTPSCASLSFAACVSVFHPHPLYVLPSLVCWYRVFLTNASH